MGDPARMATFKECIKDCLDKGWYSHAITLIQTRFSAATENAEKCVLLELQSHCYSRDGGNYNAVECLRNCLHLQGSGGNEFEYAESNYILGAALYKSRKLDSALSVFQSALSYDIEPEWKEKIEAYVIQIEKDKEADELERVKRANELIASEEELKKETEDKKRKTKNKSKKALENISAWQSQKGCNSSSTGKSRR